LSWRSDATTSNQSAGRTFLSRRRSIKSREEERIRSPFAVCDDDDDENENVTGCGDDGDGGGYKRKKSERSQATVLVGLLKEDDGGRHGVDKG